MKKRKIQTMASVKCGGHQTITSFTTCSLESGKCKSLLAFVDLVIECLCCRCYMWSSAMTGAVFSSSEFFDLGGYRAFPDVVAIEVQVRELLEVDCARGIFRVGFILSLRWYDAHFDSSKYAPMILPCVRVFRTHTVCVTTSASQVTTRGAARSAVTRVVVC